MTSIGDRMAKVRGYGAALGLYHTRNQYKAGNAIEYLFEFRPDLCIKAAGDPKSRQAVHFADAIHQFSQIYKRNLPGNRAEQMHDLELALACNTVESAFPLLVNWMRSIASDVLVKHFGQIFLGLTAACGAEKFFNQIISTIPTELITSVALDEFGNAWCGASINGYIGVRAGKDQAILHDFGRIVHSIDMDHKGQRIAIGADNGIYVVEATSFQGVYSYQTGGRVLQVSWAKDGSVAAKTDRHIYWWDGDPTHKPFSAVTVTPCASVGVTQDGNFLLIDPNEYEVKVMNTKTREITFMQSFESRVTASAIAGDYVAVVTADHQIMLWDYTMGKDKPQFEASIKKTLEEKKITGEVGIISIHHHAESGKVWSGSLTLGIGSWFISFNPARTENRDKGEDLAKNPTVYQMDGTICTIESKGNILLVHAWEQIKAFLISRNGELFPLRSITYGKAFVSAATLSENSKLIAGGTINGKLFLAKLSPE